ncbi:tRNA (cytidine/uridine-2'-O-)-methyltransferase [Desulfonispora thiosulfatigenes DSM 11270]|uniref:Putative tRNA (cytidine(34)-2'-O)-methyltransferase n=1 Tax=Desulfonispora thiosulfatigenes DSM 11270 TaxID=656914 RepID=A0A1W1VMW8_DESTI|nr:tRNA (uridine(34)/cytosine(34)/5-carboxymethylaminomethyluridine(34)-2'-O)-methyltransferase TrmL [Desulfonispora thiosulfatigenes]SMB94570.1 tRNA (cytidine/uridine-2'-O-)-methyltransferase [Desulfonispora thiosulfatigenes DSM 11270]
MFNIVLVEPEIPSNTGNIARTCAVTGCNLHLIKPLGFFIDDKSLKRAGLDYWDMLNVKVYENLDHFFKENENGNFYLATTKGSKNYTTKNYNKNDYFIFGKETKGLPVDVLKRYPNNCIKIPMLENEKARSLNLANSVAVIIYEALRQINFDI